MLKVRLLYLAVILDIIELLRKILGYGLIRVLQHFGASYMHYRFPIGYLMVYLLIIVIVPVIVSSILVRVFQKESLVLRLRNIG